MGQLALIHSVADSFLPRAQGSLPGPADDYWFEPIGKVSAGQRVTPNTALTFSGCWAATNAIAGLFGALPLKSYKPTPDGRTEAKKHPTWRLFTREPNPEMDSFVFWEMMTQWWINYGNAFAEIQRLEDSGRLYALWPIHPSRVTPERNQSRIWTGRWKIRNNNAEPSYLEASEMLNIVGALSDDGLIGKGVLTYAAQSIGVGLAEQSYKGEFYANGGRPTGILEHPSKLSGPARDELRREWKQIHGKGSDIAVLWEGMKFNTVSVDPEHAKLLDSQLFSVQEMSRFYDLPPHVLYELSKGTFANVEEMNRFLVSQPIGKRLVRVEKALDRQLFNDDEKEAGYYCKFNVNALLRGDPKQQAEINQIKFQNGALSQNEWRAQDELNKLPEEWGNKTWVRRDMATTELVLKAAEQGEPAKLPDNPPTPDTPPTPDKNNKWERRARRLRKEARQNTDEIVVLCEKIRSAKVQRDELTNKLTACETLVAEKDREISTWQASREAIEDAHNELAGKYELLNGQNTALLTKFAGLTSDYEESQALIAEQHAKLDDRNTLLVQASGNIEALAAKLKSAEATIATHEAADAMAVAEIRAAREALQAAEKARDDAKACWEQAEGEAIDETRRAELLEKEKTAIESQLAKSDARGETFKTKCESLATELGSIRAERDTFKAQAERAAKAGEELSATVAATKKRLEIAEKQTLSSESQAFAAKEGALEQLKAARLSVAASVRGLLDESLARLLSDEADQIKNAARKPDQFKQIADGYYHHLQTLLTAQLKYAADAMEQVGGYKSDVAKIAAGYVSDSRTRVHNLIHKTPRADLRTAARQEVETWEARRQTLLNWIGE